LDGTAMSLHVPIVHDNLHRGPEAALDKADQHLACTLPRAPLLLPPLHSLPPPCATHSYLKDIGGLLRNQELAASVLFWPPHKHRSGKRAQLLPLLADVEVRRWPDPRARTAAGPFALSAFACSSQAALEVDERKRAAHQVARRARVERLRERMAERAFWMSSLDSRPPRMTPTPPPPGKARLPRLGRAPSGESGDGEDVVAGLQPSTATIGARADPRMVPRPPHVPHSTHTQHTPRLPSSQLASPRRARVVARAGAPPNAVYSRVPQPASGSSGGRRACGQADAAGAGVGAGARSTVDAYRHSEERERLCAHGVHDDAQTRVAAVTIQKRTRGAIGRRQHARQQAHQSEGALAVQRIWRGCQGRATRRRRSSEEACALAARREHASVVLQHAVRTWLRQIHDTPQSLMAAHCRGIEAKLGGFVPMRRKLEHDSAINLQRWWRHLRLRKVVQAVLVIQQSARARKAPTKQRQHKRNRNATMRERAPAAGSHRARQRP